MADFKILVPHLLYRETGRKPISNDAEVAFAGSAAVGVVTLKGDRGGPTFVGVTLQTFTDYCKKKGLPRPTVDDLGRMDFRTWFDISKGGFWDRCKGDQIAFQPTANMLVDWAYTSGTHAISNTQKALGLKPDGIVGPVTLAALNSGTIPVFMAIKASREAFYRRIATGAQASFLNGWLNRTNAITLNGINFN